MTQSRPRWSARGKPAGPPFVRFDDFDLPTLIGMRKEARLAKHSLLTGKRAASLGEANGFGSKSVTYHQSDLPGLSAYIQELDDEIVRRQTGGGRGGRRPFYIT